MNIIIIQFNLEGDKNTFRRRRLKNININLFRIFVDPMRSKVLYEYRSVYLSIMFCVSIYYLEDRPKCMNSGGI